LEVRQDGSSNPIDQQVWDTRYIDAMIVRFHDGNTDGDYTDTGDNITYPMTDANFDVTGLMDGSSGNVIERYSYLPYGQFTVLDADFSIDADGLSDVGWGHLFQGGRYDADRGMYDFRNRALSPDLGQWQTRDPLGYAGGGANMYQFQEADPVTSNDPFGLTAEGSGGLPGTLPASQPTTLPASAQKYYDELNNPDWKQRDAAMGNLGGELAKDPQLESVLKDKRATASAEQNDKIDLILANEWLGVEPKQLTFVLPRDKDKQKTLTVYRWHRTKPLLVRVHTPAGNLVAVDPSPLIFDVNEGALNVKVAALNEGTGDIRLWPEWTGKKTPDDGKSGLKVTITCSQHRDL
jgi:RHS repeat-associated protein